MKKGLKFLISLVLIIGLLSGLTFHTSSHAATTKKMSVHYINVGQGDSTLIRAPYGENILIDGGNINGSNLVSYLKKQGIKTIDVMVSTHPDADHIGGLDDVLKSFDVKSVYAPKVNHTTQAYVDFLKAVKAEKLTIKTAQKGVKVPVKGVTATFVAPVKTYDKDLNDWSAVLRVVYNKKSFLFTGDAEFKSETDMLNSKQTLKADVLKVGHHGAKTSTSQAFLNAVKPSVAVISVGKGNRYGHPTTETLNRLKASKIAIYRTDLQGHIIITTDGNTLTYNTKAAVPGGAVPAPAPSTYKLVATLDNAKPKQNGTVNLTVKGLPSGSYKAVFHYKSTNTTYTGTIGKALPVKIGRAAKGYKVVVDISSAYKGKSYKTQTSFVPQ
ncbi:beta-lactamase [Priestia koreensis]|uniref:Beta-lactamase n=1 Tax=Priestia koreensis TaxID=284581 RepID=A0A0M0KPL0_9BACI|nr:beta-lactamase [Priestia koreensis]